MMPSDVRSWVSGVCGTICCAFLLQGCTTVPSEDDRIRAAVLTDISNIHDDLNAINGRQEQTEKSVEGLSRVVKTLGGNDAAEKAAMERRLSAMESRIGSVDEAREADKKEIIERLSRSIADYINKNRETGGGAAGGRHISTGGGDSGTVEHVVKEKETLSVIAQNYGVAVGAIVEVNRLKNANVVRVGQVLKIPR